MSLLISGLKLGEFLGKGNYGAVYKGHEPAAGEVAVKIIFPDPTKSLSEWRFRKEQLLKEGQNLRKAQHPNIVRVHNILASHTDDSLHLVMDLCPGGSLMRDYEAGPMQLADVRKIASEVTLGIQAIHARGMIHRDIKPANILRDEKGVAKVGDFGLVTDELILGYARACGYTDHLALEVRQGRGTSVKSDVWALGMTIYRLLHGADWYKHAPPPRTLVGEGNFRETLEWLPHVPKKWKRLIREMLCDDTARRTASASAVLMALARLPVEPDWICSSNPGGVTWTRIKGNRRHTVEWDTSNRQKCTWRARNEPIAKGNTLQLGASPAPTSYARSSRELAEFFSKCA